MKRVGRVVECYIEKPEGGGVLVRSLGRTDRAVLRNLDYSVVPVAEVQRALGAGGRSRRCGRSTHASRTAKAMEAKERHAGG